MNMPDFSVRTGSEAQDEGTVCIFAETLKEELNEDFLLPDSVPDVKKILSARFCTELTDQSCDAGGFRYEGECFVSLVCVTDTNRLKNVSFPIRFRHSETGKDGFTQETKLLLFPKVTKCDPRLLSPRKCSVRIGLEVIAAAFASVPLRYIFEGKHTEEDVLMLETLEEECRTVRVRSASKTGIPFRADPELDPNQPGIGEIIESRLDADVSSVSFREGEAQIEGELTFTCLLETENNKFLRFRKTYAFEQCVEFPESERNTFGFCTAQIRNLKTSAQNNSYGERRVIEIDADIDLKLSAFQPAVGKITSDLFSVSTESTLKTENVPICFCSSPLSSSCTVNQKLPRSEHHAEKAGIPFDGNVLLSDFTVRFDPEKKKWIAEGNAELTLLSELQRENEETGREFLSVQSTQSVRCEIDPKGFSAVRAVPLLTVSSLTFRADENDLCADYEVHCTLLPIAEEPVTYVSSVSLDREKNHEAIPGSEICLYYPEAGETLWQVAKRFHTSRAAIMEANGLSAENGDRKVIRIPSVEPLPSFTGTL